MLRCCRHGAEQGRGTPACATAPRYSGAAGTALCPSTGRVPRCSALSRGAWGPLGTTLWDRDWCHWGTVLPVVPVPLVPHSSLSGGVSQLSQPGRGSEMTPHCSWQQHLPWPFWGSPGIQLHWEHLWERGEEDQYQLFCPWAFPTSWGKVCGTQEISGTAPQLGRFPASEGLRVFGAAPQACPPQRAHPAELWGSPFPGHRCLWYLQRCLEPFHASLGLLWSFAGAQCCLGAHGQSPCVTGETELSPWWGGAQCHGATTAHPGTEPSGVTGRAQ